MEVKTSVECGKAVIELEGKLTVQTAPELSAAVDGLPAGVCEIDIDLTRLDYIASAGIRVLVAADKHAVAHGGRVRLLHPCDDVMEIFEMTGLSEVFVIER